MDPIKYKQVEALILFGSNWAPLRKQIIYINFKHY